MTTAQLVALARVRSWSKSGRAKSIRAAAGLTLVEMAAQVGVSDAAISRWETGVRSPSGDAALAYAALLDALVAEGFTGEECEDCEQPGMVEHGDDHFGSTSNATTEKPWDGSAGRFTDEQYKMATAACDGGDGSIKQRCFLPHHEPAGTINVNGVHAAAQRVSSLKGHDSAAVSRAKAHLRSHYSKLKEDPPDSIKASAAARQEFERLIAEIELALGDEGETFEEDWIAEQFAGLHEAYSGTHTHAHSPYGQQGDDETHEHSHSHDGDNLHRHSHGDSSIVAAGHPGRRPEFRSSFQLDVTDTERARWAGVLEGIGFTASGAGELPRWAVREVVNVTAAGDETNVFEVLSAAGGDVPVAIVESYVDALGVIGEALAAAGDRPTLPTQWRSEMAYEGVLTGDGRYIEPGGIQFRDTPLPLMLQTETAGGHMGAVLSGSINLTGKLGNIALGMGDFDATDAGRQFNQIIEARDRFGVSIDVAEADGAPQCTVHGEDLDACDYDCEWEFHFSLVRVMGLTGTPFPAFEDAFIEFATMAGGADGDSSIAASAAVEEDEPEVHLPERIEFIDEDGTEQLFEEIADFMRRPLDDELQPVTAAGSRGAVHPPLAWFEDPAFRVGDGRLVRQPDGHYACPLTVDEPDPVTGLRRVYGHMASWFTCHTAIQNRCQTAPRSSTDYAAFNLRPVMTAEGKPVNVGHLTMGVGHASTDPRLAVADVRAHYDGGPGAVRMAWVRTGEDQFGVWFSGVVHPDRTEREVESFEACSVSGDWREVWRGKGLELVACLAGVTSPGFPVTPALAASGALPVPVGATVLPGPRAGFRNDRAVALVAAGVVRQPMPWERQLASMEGELEELRSWREGAEKTVGALRPLAAEALLARARGEEFAAPTSVDKTVAAALGKIASAVDAAIAAQQKDPDNGTDPDDKAVSSGLELLKSTLGHVLTAQAKDGDTEEAPEAGS